MTPKTGSCLSIWGQVALVTMHNLTWIGGSAVGKAHSECVKSGCRPRMSNSQPVGRRNEACGHEFDMLAVGSGPGRGNGSLD